jgi:transcriptional regulator with XRE-family HTH domain
MLPAMPTDKLLERLAAVLRGEADAKTLTQAELAARAGLLQQHVSDVLRGKYPPNTRSLLAILRALGRDLAWLHKQGITPDLTEEE